MGKKVLGLLILAICTMFLVMPIHAEELIQNGTFDENTDNWVHWAGGGGDVSIAAENGEARLKINNTGNEVWTVQFRQNISIVAGTTYVIKFDARSTTPRTIRFMLERSGGAQPYPVYYGPVDVDLTTEMATYTFEGTVEITEPNAHLIFCLGKVGRIGRVHTVYLDNVSITTK